MALDAQTVGKILRDARQAVDEAEIPEPLQAVAFGKAIDLLSGGAAPPAATRQQTREQEETGEEEAATGGGSLARIAQELGIDQQAVEQVYEVDDGEIHVAVPARQLSAQARPAMRTVIHLAVLGRQLGGWGETSVDDVKGECERFPSRYDGNNFRNALNGLDTYVRVGRGRNARVRLLAAGETAGAELITRLAAGEQA